MKKLLLLVTALLLISWGAVAQFAGGDGTSGNPYQIATAEQLDNVRNYRTNHFILTSNIDLAGYANWLPICNSSTQFSGSFDGNGFTISNLTINRPSDSYVGLFGYFQPAVAGNFIKNIKLTSVNIIGSNTIGAVVGECYNATIHNCSMEGQLSGSNTIGGIAGKAIVASTISNCYTNVTINALHGNCGGIVGSVWYGGSLIKECFSKGEIYSSNQANGGIVGSFGMDGLGSLENCYSTTNVISNINGHYNGGIAGEISNGDKIIKNSFSTGIVEAGSSVGGVSGYVYNAAIKNCFSANTRVNVLSPNQWAYVGRIGASGFSATFTNNYAWENVYVKNEKITDGSLTNINGANITLSQIQTEAFFTNIENWADEAWNFSSIWAIDLSISPYPILQAVPSAFQKVQHSQGIFWTVPFAFGINTTIENVANGGINAITYQSTNPAVIEVVGNTLVTHSAGTADITATIAESEFYAENSITQTFTVYEAGSGTKEDPFLISTIDELNSIRNNVSLHYKLANDIDLASIPNWEPIGQSYPFYFTGSFDGNNHTISNLTIYQPSNSLVAFFGRFEPSTPGDSIKNLTLSNVNITGNSQSASIVAEVVKGHIHNCHSSGSITALNNTGGIVGQLSYYGAGKSKEIGLGITNCTSSCNVTVQFENAGGIVGRIEGEYNTKLSQYENAVITNCSSSGTISGLNNVAGIAGYASSCEITQCFSTGNATGTNSTGGIIGNGKDNLIINQCFSNGAFSTNEDNVGGIIGFYNKGDITSVAIISNSYSTGTVKSDTQLRAGGICGYASSPLTISNCYSTGLVSSTNLSGGIAGDMSESTIINCFAANAKVFSKGGAGRLICDNDGVNTFINNYGWDNVYVNDAKVVGGQLNDQFGLNATIAQFGSTEFFTNSANWNTEPWDFTSTWEISSETSPYPILKNFDLSIQQVKHAQVITWNQDMPEPIQVNDEITLTADGGVNAIAYTSSNPQVASITESTLTINATGKVEITATIPESEFYAQAIMTKTYIIFDGGDGTVDNPYLISNLEQLNDVRNNLSAHYKLIANIDMGSIVNWEPIGSMDDVFTGSFDGNNLTLSNLTVNKPNDEYIGLFSSCTSAETEVSIKNLNVVDANIICMGYGGVIAGFIEYSGTIENCHTSGTVKGGIGLGGIVGAIGQIGISITNCSSSCIINSTDSRAGGIVGEFYGSTSIENCSFNGEVKAAYDEVGGIVGWMYQGFILNCHSTGNVSGINKVGGIVGFADNNSIVTECFSHANVFGTSNVGGIAGTLWDNSAITNTYSTGNINALNSGNRCGGIVGYAYNSTVQQNYSTGKITGDTETGGITGYTSGALVKYNAAINAKIGEQGFLGRINGRDYSSSTLSYNYAWDEMYVAEALISDGTLFNLNGLNASFENLSTESFYTTTGNWDSNPWNFTETWVMNSEVSPYPILQSIATEPQQVKHAQAITWPQDIATPIGNSLTLTAVGGRTGSTIVYSSSQSDVASIVGDEMTVNTTGGSHIMAYVEGNDFFAADSVKKVLINFENNGTELEPYLIYNLAELDAVRFNLNAHYKLMADIDMSPIANWEPIGNSSTYFGGSFDGNNFELTNLNINKPFSSYVGLFGYIEVATIKNLAVNNVNIIGYESVGAIAGIAYNNSLIENCGSSGEISSTGFEAGGIIGAIYSNTLVVSCKSTSSLTSQYYPGGIIGSASESSISRCYYSGILIGNGAGGIAGRIQDNSLITQSFSVGNFSGNEYIGGICGETSGGEIINCYSAANVQGNSIYVGGITGYLISSSSVSYSFSTGVVYGGDDKNGGIVGYLQNSSLVNSVALAAKISGIYSTERVVGSFSNETLANNYAWTDLYVNDSKATDGTLANENGQNAALSQLKSEAFYTTAANWDGDAWDFETVWEMNEGISPYPILKNIPADVQKVQHAQVMTNAWTQALTLNAAIASEITLTAPSEGPSELLAYESSNTEVAIISNGTLIPVGFGSATISVMYPETEFYTESNSFAKTITVTNKGTLSIGGSFTALDKEYDGTNAATMNENNLTLVGKYSGHSVSLDNILVEFASPAIANNVVVNITNADISGIDVDKYELSLTGAPSALANIIEHVDVDTDALKNLSVYPNPFTNTLNIVNAESIQRVVVSNIIGKVVMEIELNLSPIQTLTTSLPSGVYLVTLVATDGRRVVIRMVRK